MENVESKVKLRSIFARLLKYTKGHGSTYALALVFVGINVAVDLFIPFATGYSLKLLGEDPIDIKNFLLFNALAILAIIIMAFSQYMQTYLLNKNGNRIVFNIRNEVLSHIQKLSHNQFHNIPTGKLVTRVTSDINVIYEFFTNILVSLLKNVFTLVGVFIAMALLNIKLTLILLIVTPVLTAFAIIFSKVSRKVHRKVRDNVSQMNAFLSENISGIKVTQVFGQESKIYREFEDNNNKLKKSILKEIFVFGIFRPSIFLLYVLSIVIVVWFGGNEAINVNLGILSVGITYDLLFTFYQYIAKFFNPIQILADQFNELQSSIASAEKIFTVLDMVPEIVDSEDAIEMEIKGDIEFKNVWFAYIPGDWILKDVSFHIKAGSTAAFVGATGAGKTTALALITRNYDVTKGQILIDGVDIRHIKLDCLRSQIGQMLQDVFLFSGTINSNITLNEDVDEAEVKRCSEYVNASKFIEKLPDGYETLVRERGENFSLGQRQLISFARTIITKPNIMILDEATSNIDTETELLIQDSLTRILKLGTVVIVAHRLSTIQHCDKIFVFDRGTIIESGNHQELLANHGRYYSLYQLQFSQKIGE